MTRERILITVKTYPVISKKYGELVCTAGVRKDGSWVRLYPVPFRLLDYAKRYRKFDWIEADLRKSRKDRRPESYHPKNQEEIAIVGHLDAKDKWRERRRLILGKCKVFDRFQPLLDAARKNRMSLAVFKPTKIIDFKCQESEPDWALDKIKAIKAREDQGELFAGEEDWRKSFVLMPKVPWKFSYTFKDAIGKQSTLQILDWEISQLYWNCLKKTGGKQSLALEKVREKYMGQFLKKDLHFFLGTLLEFHQRAPNPWSIIGVCPIPHQTQMELI